MTPEQITYSEIVTVRDKENEMRDISGMTLDEIKQELNEMNNISCCEPFGTTDPKDVDGRCPECGGLTVEGEAAVGCCYSPVDCEVCNSSPCDGSC
jgi:PHP family Zn ribbon phosphoesterase